MRLDTTLNKKNAAVTSSIDAVSVARHGGLNSDRLHSLWREAIVNMGKAPQWAVEYVRGYQDCLSKALYHAELIYGGFIDGVFYSVHRSRADYYEKHNMSAKDWHDAAVGSRGHYWAHSLKPYFIGDGK